MNIIEVNELCKHYKRPERKNNLKDGLSGFFSRKYKIVKAVDNISMKINRGEIVGFIGPNGAGKSTTIKMLIGVLKPTSGEIVIDGLVPFRNRIKHVEKIGVVLGQRTQLWWDLPVIESLKLLKDVYKISDAAFKQNLVIFNELVDFSKLYNVPVRQLSLGQRTLCDVLAAFLHDPKLIFLDEPTIGLDIFIKKQVRQIISFLNEKKNTTVLITSHDTGDIEALCRRIILIDKGSLVYDSPAEAFNKLFGHYRTLKVDLSSFTASDTINAVREALLHQFGQDGDALRIVIENGTWLKITLNQEKINLLDAVKFIINRFDVKDIKIEEIALEQVISKIYEGKVS